MLDSGRASNPKCVIQRPPVKEPNVTARLPQEVKILLMNSWCSGAEEVTVMLLIKNPAV